MFDFSVLISLLVSVLIFYFTIFFTLKRELDDLSNTIKKSNEIESKINTRRKNLKLLNILATILIIVILLLYNLPSINVALSDINPIRLPDIGSFLIKLTPFKEGFFLDSNFTFSYITGIVFSLIILIIDTLLLYISLDHPLIDVIVKWLLVIISSIALILGFLWLNYYMSLFLTYCIVHYFVFLSIIFNIILYGVIFSILTFLTHLLANNTYYIARFCYKYIPKTKS